MTDEPQPDAPTVATPVASPRSAGSRTPRLADGAVLAERFRIVRFIARGGMGEVYEAEDRVAADAEARGYRLIAREARSAPR